MNDRPEIRLVRTDQSRRPDLMTSDVVLVAPGRRRVTIGQLGNTLAPMVSLIVHGLLGVVVVWLIVRSNPAIFRRVGSGPLLSPFELALYVVGVASVGAGWYFNIRFVTDYTDGWLTNPLWGDGSWVHYLRLLFDNPAAGSASVDFSIANVVVLPLVTIVHGRRVGIQRPWLFFVATLFTSFSFGWAFYVATLERQRRLATDDVPALA